MNGMALEDVNACGDDAQPLESRLLANVTANVGPIFAKYAMTPYYTVCFDAPRVVSNVSSDPNAPEAEHWWKAKAAELYQAMPSLGGFLLKSDSEGNIGSRHFNADSRHFNADSRHFNADSRHLTPIRAI